MSTWNKLSKIDVSEYVEKKGNLSYISWAWAWGKLMENCPDSVYEFQENEVHADGTVTVHCTLTVDGVTREMWLPVMDYKNNAEVNPTARKISDTKMRCLTKAIAMFGLGHYIYAGEDLPEAVEEKKPSNTKPEYTAKQIEANRDAWIKLFDSKKKTPDDIINKIKAEYALDEWLELEIRNLEAPF